MSVSTFSLSCSQHLRTYYNTPYINMFPLILLVFFVLVPCYLESMQGIKNVLSGNNIPVRPGAKPIQLVGWDIDLTSQKNSICILLKWVLYDIISCDGCGVFLPESVGIVVGLVGYKNKTHNRFPQVGNGTFSSSLQLLLLQTDIFREERTPHRGR